VSSSTGARRSTPAVSDRDDELERAERTRRRFVITGAVTIGFVAVLLLFAFVFPTRTYVEQRQDLSRERERLEVLQEENARLAARIAELQTETEVERIAREQFNMVRPDEEAYAILPPTTTAPSPLPG